MKTINKFLRWYLHSVCKYEIKDPGGTNNLVANAIDVVVYLSYLAITLYVLWKEGVATLPFFTTVLLMVRSYLKYQKLYNQMKKKYNGNSVTIAFMLRRVVYLMLILIACVLVLCSTDVNIGKLVLSICYVFFAIFELTDILVDCFNAEPTVFKS